MEADDDDQEINLLDSIFAEKSKEEDRKLAVITREGKAFDLQIFVPDRFLLKVNPTSFFLDKPLMILVGDPFDPHLVFGIEELDFPKLRVNFNGLRIRTKEKNHNWSNMYMINEESKKPGLHLVQLNSEKKEKVILDDKKAIWKIGSDEHCQIKTPKGGILGFIRYIEDIGWIVKTQADRPISDGYGIYIRLPSNLKEFKLYQGMTLLMNRHIIHVTQLS